MLDLLSKKTVGIAGCGGLGSNCAASLVRSGVGRIILADFDVVTESNLNRQFYFNDQVGQKKVHALRDNLLRINPDVEIVIHDIRLEKDDIASIFSGCNIIVEAFDQAEAKMMIIEAVMEHFPDKPIVSGVGLAGWGGNDLLTTRQEGNLVICGDGMNEVAIDHPPLGPRVGIVSHMQANMVMELLLGPCPWLKTGEDK